MRYGAWLSRSLRLARTMRWAIVASGTRNARAISSVSSPPSSRRVERDLRVDPERRMAAQEHEPELVVGDDVDEGVEVGELGAVVGFHGLGVEPVGGEVAVGCVSTRGGAGRSPGCGRSW